jgi:hypothetical protein
MLKDDIILTSVKLNPFLKLCLSECDSYHRNSVIRSGREARALRSFIEPIKVKLSTMQYS